MRLAFMKARARISRLITMRLKAAWQNTITLTPMRRQRACSAWRLIGEMGVERTFEMAQCCYLALMTDTGRFQFQNTTPGSVCACGRNGVGWCAARECSQEIYQRRSAASLGLEGVMLSNMQIAPSGEWALSYARLDDFERLGAVKADAEPLIDVLRWLLDGIRVACMLREQEDVVAWKPSCQGRRH